MSLDKAIQYLIDAMPKADGPGDCIVMTEAQARFFSEDIKAIGGWTMTGPSSGSAYSPEVFQFGVASVLSQARGPLPPGLYVPDIEGDDDEDLPPMGCP